jgi:hypothetical protein
VPLLRSFFNKSASCHLSGDHHDGQRWIAYFKEYGQIDSVHAGQHDVDDSQLGIPIGDGLDRLLCRINSPALITFMLEDLNEGIREDLFVIDNENSGTRHSFAAENTAMKVSAASEISVGCPLTGSELPPSKRFYSVEIVLS